MSNQTSHKIAVVFDPEYGVELLKFAKEMHVWAINSEKNNDVFRAQGSIPYNDCDPLATGITIFEGSEMTAGFLDTICEHHGEFAHEPPLSEMKIIGLELGKDLVVLLEEYDFNVCSHSDGEFDVVTK